MTHVMTRPTLQAIAGGCGLLMATSAGAGAGAAGPVATLSVLLTIAAVPAGLLLRRAAPVAVLLAVTAILLCDPPSALAAVAGLAAVGYLVLGSTADGVAAVTVPTVLAAVGFGFVGLVAVAFPLQVPWLPLLAPPAVFGCYVLAVRPFLGDWAGGAGSAS